VQFFVKVGIFVAIVLFGGNFIVQGLLSDVAPYSFHTYVAVAVAGIGTILAISHSAEKIVDFRMLLLVLALAWAVMMFGKGPTIFD
jgi:hypothetical protein